MGMPRHRRRRHMSPRANLVCRGPGRWGMDVNPVPGQVCGTGFERDSSSRVLIPPRILGIALYTIPHFDDGEHAAHRDVVPEKACGPFHRDAIRRHRHHLRHPPHVHSRMAHRHIARQERAQTASEFCLRQCGLKPTLLGHRHSAHVPTLALPHGETRPQECLSWQCDRAY
jgi:hypothetical protein